MLLLDLRWFLLALLLLLVVAVGVAVWFDRWLYRRSSAPLIEDEERWLPLLAHLPFGVCVLDEGGTYRYANRAAQRLLDLDAPPGPLPDVAWVAQLEEDREATREQAATTGRFRTATLRGEQAVRWWVTTWEQWDLIILQDATAQQRAEQDARFLISDLSHELRTPLAALLTHLEVLRIESLPEATRAQSLEMMQGEAKRMTRLVHSLLELGRLETSAEIEQRPVELLPLAEEKEITLSLEGHAPLPLVVGDRDRLRQLLLILLDNAIKYSRMGDRVTVRLTEGAEGLCCEVRDSGPGIPAEHLPYLTRRFYRANQSERVSGSGLGLALAA